MGDDTKPLRASLSSTGALHIHVALVVVRYIKKMSRIKFLSLVIIFNLSFVFSQNRERIEDSVHIYWQPNINLNLNDFEFDGTKEENAEMYCEKIKLCVCAATNINIIIDSPTNNKKRNKDLEKIFIVPVFDKNMSYALTKDTIGVNQQKLIFDIEEWTARYIRQELEKIKKQFKDRQDFLITWHKVVLNEAQKKKRKLIEEYTLDVYLEPKPNAYRDWRIKVDNMLKELKDYATTKEECNRFLYKKTIEKNYEQSVFLGCKNHN